MTVAPDGTAIPQSAFWMLYEPRKKAQKIKANLESNRRKLGINRKPLRRHNRLTH